jgi:hypothetical protein
MVVMFLVFCVGVYGTFCTIPTLGILRRGSFLFPLEPLSVKLLISSRSVYWRSGMSLLCSLSLSNKQDKVVRHNWHFWYLIVFDWYWTKIDGCGGVWERCWWESRGDCANILFRWY